MNHRIAGDSKHKSEREICAIYWEKKSALRIEYGHMYMKIKSKLVPGKSLELGSGLCHIKHWLPDCETSETSEGTPADSVQSAYSIQKPAGSLGNIIALDVWHHLEYPSVALKEWKRVLASNGRVILLEPAMSLLGEIVYGLIHQEGTGWKRAFGRGIVPPDPPYFSSQSSAHRLFVQKEWPEILQGWSIHVERWPALSYLATGGYRHNEIKSLSKVLSRLEPCAAKFLWATACRMMIVLEPLQNET